MTARDDLDRRLDAFLADGPTELPTASYEVARDRIDHTRQRVVVGPWRLHAMNKLIPIGVGAAAVVGVVLIGSQLVGSPSSGGSGAAPLATPAPSASPAPLPSAPPLPVEGEIPAGTYLMSDGESAFSVTVPPGWDTDGTDLRKHRDTSSEVTLQLYAPDIAVYPDACATEEDPPTTGPTADDLVQALQTQENSDLSDPVATTVGGRAGVRVDVSIPESLDVSGCTEGNVRIWTGSTDGNFLAGLGPQGTAPVFIIEAPGGRVVFTKGNESDATAEDIAELEAIVDSIRFADVP